MTSFSGTGLIRARRTSLSSGGLLALLAASMILAALNVGQAIGATPADWSPAPTVAVAPDNRAPFGSYQFYEDALTEAAIEIESARDLNEHGCVMIVTHPLPTGESERTYADRYDLRAC